MLCASGKIGGCGKKEKKKKQKKQTYNWELITCNL